MHIQTIPDSELLLNRLSKTKATHGPAIFGRIYSEVTSEIIVLTLGMLNQMV